jgi:hypothetical protein
VPERHGSAQRRIDHLRFEDNIEAALIDTETTMIPDSAGTTPFGIFVLALGNSIPRLERIRTDAPAVIISIRLGLSRPIKNLRG